MAEPLEIITAAEMDKMTPQQRADVVELPRLRDQLASDFVGNTLSLPGSRHF